MVHASQETEYQSVTPRWSHLWAAVLCYDKNVNSLRLRQVCTYLQIHQSLFVGEFEGSTLYELSSTVLLLFLTHTHTHTHTHSHTHTHKDGTQQEPRDSEG